MRLTVRLRSRLARGLIIDLLFASSGIESEIVFAADELVVAHQLRMPIATVGHLVALKLLSHDDDRRRQDLIDLRELTLVAKDDDWATAGEACELITKRRFHRGRDLLAMLNELRSRSISGPSG